MLKTGIKFLNNKVLKDITKATVNLTIEVKLDRPDDLFKMIEEIEHMAEEQYAGEITKSELILE